MQLEGKKRMQAAEFLRGNPVPCRRACRLTVPVVSPARDAAFKILLAVERGQSYADDLLRGKLVNALSAADRNLTTALVLGVLRWQIRLDHQLRPLLKHPNARLDVEILVALRLGAYQLLHLDRIPAHAAIDESVELAKRAGHKFASGMVNAVLRKVAKASAPPPTIRIIELNAVGKEVAAASPAEIPFTPDAVTELVHNPSTSAHGARLRGPSFLRKEEIDGRAFGCIYPDSAVALAETHPVWMVERWIAHYGIDAARSICIHGQTQPVLSVRIPDVAMEGELKQAGIEFAPGALLTVARTVISGDATSIVAVVEGRVRIQDEGSQLVAELASASPEDSIQEIKNIIDACAAPGGKTLILAERNPQARILACESSPARWTALSERLAPHLDRIECRLADATALEQSSAFDLVLADVPCSGTGTLGRNPEIRHRLRLEDLPRHAERQRAILSAALRAVRPGGSVVYSTCSLEPEENEQVVAAVVADMRSARQVSLASRIKALHSAGIVSTATSVRLQNSLTPEGALRLLPGVFPTDGFFVALIARAN